MSSPLVTAARDESVASRTARQEVRLVSARKSVPARLADVWRYRELLLSLVRKELKVKYKDSILGFAWSMLNPLFTLTIYYVVFQIILGNRQPLFAIYLLSGLLVWNFFSSALAGATGSVTGNGSIVKKVSFPREVLPLASVGAAGFNFLLQLVVMVFALAIGRHMPSPSFLLLAVLAAVVLTLLAAALSIFLAAVNVQFRDTQHLLELVLMLWFWGTPIVYPFMQVFNQLKAHEYPTWLAEINPITPITLTFQHAFYNMQDPAIHDKATGRVTSVMQVLPHNSAPWYLLHLGYTAVIAAIIMCIALSVFGRLEGNFAEEL